MAVTAIKLKKDYDFVYALYWLVKSDTGRPQLIRITVCTCVLSACFTFVCYCISNIAARNRRAKQVINGYDDCQMQAEDSVPGSSAARLFKAAAIIAVILMTGTAVLEYTGVIGSPSSEAGSYTTLKKGSSGPDVEKLQQALIDLGYDLGSGGADGIYKRDTQAAVKAFQKDNGLTVDGIAGYETQYFLYNASVYSEADTQAEAAYAETSPGSASEKEYTQTEAASGLQTISALGLIFELPEEYEIYEEEEDYIRLKYNDVDSYEVHSVTLLMSPGDLPIDDYSRIYFDEVLEIVTDTYKAKTVETDIPQFKNSEIDFNLKSYYLIGKSIAQDFCMVTFRNDDAGINYGVQYVGYSRDRDAMDDFITVLESVRFE